MNCNSYKIYNIHKYLRGNCFLDCTHHCKTNTLLVLLGYVHTHLSDTARCYFLARMI